MASRSITKTVLRQVVREELAKLAGKAAPKAGRKTTKASKAAKGTKAVRTFNGQTSRELIAAWQPGNPCPWCQAKDGILRRDLGVVGTSPTKGLPVHKFEGCGHSINK